MNNFGWAGKSFSLAKIVIGVGNVPAKLPLKHFKRGVLKQ
jgi:hypothetical protein